MAIEEVEDWAPVTKDNVANHPTGPQGNQASRISTSFREIQAAIARWSVTLITTIGGQTIAGALNIDGTLTANDVQAPNATNIVARNATLNQIAITQGESTQSGFSAAIYSGNNEAAQSINHGLDMATGDNGGLIWTKKRSGGTARAHILTDSVRGDDLYLTSQDTDAESFTAGAYVSNFSATGFDVGTSLNVNEDSDLNVAWSWQTTKKFEPTLGSELLTNGDFSANVTGWTNATGLITWVSGKARVDRNGGSTRGADYDGDLGLIEGETYVISSVTTIVSGTPTVAYFRIGLAIGDLDVLDYIKLGDMNVSFVAGATNFLYIGVGGDSAGVIDYDDITIKQVTNDAVTNRGLAYTCHYNPDLGFSIVGYTGDGLVGHELPHHLGVTPELSIYKNRDEAQNWIVKSELIDNDKYLLLDTTAAVSATHAATTMLMTDTTISLGTANSTNQYADNHISYHFASVAGVSKIGTYIGTDASGNYVPLDFKPAFVMIKGLSVISSWRIVDSARGAFVINPNVTDAESATAQIVFDDTGFHVNGTSDNQNGINEEYLFMAFAETSTGGSGSNTYSYSDYPYPTDADTLTIEQNTLIAFAQGFDSTGQLDARENVGAGITYDLGAGHENKHYYIYKDLAGSYGVTENRPLTGITRNDADKWGVIAPLDASLRTTARHFDYESPTGVASASGQYTTWAAHHAFDKDANDIPANNGWRIDVTSASWLQYKGTEKRILKSWRLREGSDQTETPDNFDIEGSNDGLNWTVIDSAYNTTNFDTVTNGAALWSPLQSTSGNATAYLYHRINISDNNGDATYTRIMQLEFNTILPSDYYLISKGVMYSGATDLAINRTYLAEFRTDSDGDVINSTIVNVPVAKQRFSSVDVHEDLEVFGDIKNQQVATAWVRFNGAVSPPLIEASYNVSDIVYTNLGRYEVVFAEPMDNNVYVVLATTATSLYNATAGGAGTTLRTPVTIRNDAATYVDSKMHIAIFGGKD